MIKYDSNICILNSKGSNDSAVHRDRQSRVAAVVIREPSPLQGVHARELDLGESCKRVSAVHLPFCFLNHKYAREKEKRRDTRGRGEERREREEGLGRGDGATSYFLFVHAESTCRRYRSRPSSPGGRARSRLRLTVHRVGVVLLSVHEVRNAASWAFYGVHAKSSEYVPIGRRRPV